MRELFQLKERLGFPDRRLTDPTAARCDVPPPMPPKIRPPWVQPNPSPGAAPADRPETLVRASVLANPAPEVVDRITRDVVSALRGRGAL
jgi:hypothetical protein